MNAGQFFAACFLFMILVITMFMAMKRIMSISTISEMHTYGIIARLMMMYASCSEIIETRV